jgi:hypothetical protein
MIDLTQTSTFQSLEPLKPAPIDLSSGEQDDSFQSHSITSRAVVDLSDNDSDQEDEKTTIEDDIIHIETQQG